MSEDYFIDTATMPLEYYQNMKKEIERLTDLCNKYEEEHKTTFETWKKDIKENKQLHSIIKEVRKCINYYAIEDEDFSKIYNQEEQELLEILDKTGDNNVKD